MKPTNIVSMYLLDFDRPNGENIYDISIADRKFAVAVGSSHDLGEVTDLHSSKNEYKKLSINKLREIAISKGIADASKLKKNEILKVLGDE
jgi:hypothetical protein